jgi:hypothetical protein
VDAVRNYILKKYQIVPGALLSQGMEAEVYADSPGTVLKLYAGTASLGDLRTLQDFYFSLDRQRVPYSLPRVLAVMPEDGVIVTIEQRLLGRRLSDVLRSLEAGLLDEMMQRYLAAALDVSSLEAPPGLNRYKLLDPEGLSLLSGGDWHAFLWRYITHKLVDLRSNLSRDVHEFSAKMQQLFAILQQPYIGEYRLIHGDFFPGNLLVNADNQVAALLDFGLFTFYGDYLFDIATGWVFLDMYDELKAKVRDRYLAVILNRLGTNVRGKLYRYVLVYSILSANAYSPTCSDGHYKWCVANLNQTEYWTAIE